MTVESGNQPTKWYKHTLFLILINIFGGVIGIRLLSTLIGVSYPYNDLTFFGMLFGIIYGGVLSYTLWASTDNFPQLRAVFIMGIWTVLLGGMFFTINYSVIMGCAFPFLAYGLTAILTKSWSQSTFILGATYSSIISAIASNYVIGIILPESNGIIESIPPAIGIIIYSLLLPYSLKYNSERQRHANIKQQQQAQLQNDLSEGEHTVDDDSELISIENPQITIINTAHNNQAPWYKSIRFILLLNMIGMTVAILCSYLLITRFISLRLTSTFNELAFPSSIIGMVIGGILGYTLWAMTDNFSQSRAVLISGLWAIAFGGVFLAGDYIYFMGVALPLLAYFLTLISTKSWVQASTLIIVTIISLFSMALAFLFIQAYSGTIFPRPYLETLLFGGVIYSIALTYFLKKDNEQAQRQQLQNDLSAGLLPEENYTVGDDGELIPVDDAQNNHKAQS